MVFKKKEPQEEGPAPEWPFVGMTVQEAAQALRVSTRTVQDMLSQGRLPGRLVGGKWRVSPAALERFLDAYEYEATEDTSAVRLRGVRKEEGGEE